MEVESSFDHIFHSLEELADSISGALQSQVTIEDGSHNVIGYSSHENESDQARISTIIGRRVPQSVILELRKQGILQQLEQSEHPLRIPAIEKVGLGARLAICIKNREAVLGYIWVVDTGKLAEGHAEAVVEEAAKSVKRYLLKQRSWKIKLDKSHEEFFWKLLTSHYREETRLELDAKSFPVPLPRSYYIVIFEFGAPVTDELLDKYRYDSAASASAQVQTTFLTADESRIISLVSVRPGSAVKETIRSFVVNTKRIGTGKDAVPVLASACSGEHGQYVRAADAYQEALIVLNLKKLLPYHTRHIDLFENIGFFAHLPGMLENKRKLRINSPWLQTIRAYDAENKSDYLKSLAVYLSLDCNMKTAAAHLHIHANSLTYRMNRIAEMIERNLKNTNDLVSLYVDLLTEETENMNRWMSDGQGEFAAK